jgi:hypothetical protein
MRDIHRQDHPRARLRHEVAFFRLFYRNVGEVRSGLHLHAPAALFGLIADGWVVLLGAADAPDASRLAELDSRAGEARQVVGDAVRSFLVLDAAPEHALATPALIERGDDISRIFRARDGLVALIRPDGYLGYRGLPHQSGALAVPGAGLRHAHAGDLIALTTWFHLLQMYPFEA